VRQPSKRSLTLMFWLSRSKTFGAAGCLVVVLVSDCGQIDACVGFLRIPEAVVGIQDIEAVEGDPHGCARSCGLAERLYVNHQSMYAVNDPAPVPNMPEPPPLAESQRSMLPGL